MKAAQVPEYGERDVLEVIETDKPEPGKGEVRIEVKAAGINFADIMQRRGHYHGGPKPPYIPGLEVAGVIDETGDGVGREEGERVVAMGDSGYAEYAVVDAAGLLTIPEGLSFEEAAGFPVQYLTAHNCLHEWGDLEEGESVLIHAAAGGVGTAAVQLADKAGAEIYGTASTQAKLDKATSLGCDHPINYEEENFVDVIDEQTDHGVDMVLDGIGGETTSQSLDVLKYFGRLVTYGAACGEPGRPRTDNILFGNYTVIGYHLGRAMQLKPMKVMGAVPELQEMLESGDVQVQFDRSFDLDEVEAAHEYVESRQSMGKVVITP